LYTVDMREQVIVTQFSRVVSQPVNEAGLHFKLPFLQQVNRFSKQVLEWDGRPVQTPTNDKNYIYVDNFARWKIIDPLKFMQLLRDERTAQSRLDSIVGSETRSVVANHNLIEVIRSDKNRKPPEALLAAMRLGGMPPIDSGRLSLEKEILKNAAPKTLPLGIELLDVRFKRVNYDPAVSENIFKRMITEREQIAERYRSEGAGEAAKISGNRDKELNRVQSEAYKKVQEIEGAADAKATEIYAKAYNGSRGAIDLFEFMKSMDTLKKTVTADSTLLLTTEGDLLRYLKKSQPSAPSTPVEGLKGVPGLPSLLDLPQIK
jgi:modulator of FtsH protease HflC